MSHKCYKCGSDNPCMFDIRYDGETKELYRDYLCQECWRKSMQNETKIISHWGDNGEHFPDKCYTVSFTCESCGKHVGPTDVYCKHCSKKFTGVFNDYSGVSEDEIWRSQNG